LGGGQTGGGGGGGFSFDFDFSTFCEMKSLQDLTWGAEKTEQLVFTLDIGTTSSEFGELAQIPNSFWPKAQSPFVI